jgi:tetratricopeptide (TPR) repeat protein
MRGAASSRAGKPAAIGAGAAWYNAPMHREVAAFALSLALAVPVSAAQGHSAHEIPVVPTELLERAVPLRTGIGAAHHPVTASSVEAQRFYDQGMQYLHHYMWIEAARSFHQSLRIDPNLAMAHVGLSYAYAEVNHPQAARAALARARVLAARVGPHDRQHIALRGAQLEAEGDPQDAARLAAYRRALDDALAAFPADAELRLQRGVAEAPTAADRGQGSTARSIEHFERALEIVPDHFAAHHYLAHAYENSGRIDDALRHGAMYARLAPNVPHARHMHGHQLRRVGRVFEAIAEFEAADRLGNAYFAAENVRAEFDWHHEHNLGLLAMSYQYVGQVASAGALFEKAFALPTLHLVQAFNKRERVLFLRLRGRTDEALAAARALGSHPNPVVQAIGHVEAGHVRLMQRQFAEAAAESNAALRLLKGGVAGSGLVAIPFEGLQGEFFLRTGERTKGRAMLEAMIGKARAAPGPDEWSQTLFTLESIARAARDAGDWEFAGRVAREMLAHDPAYAGTHYLLAIVADHAGDRPAAQAAFARAVEYWSRADQDLPELRDARARLR